MSVPDRDRRTLPPTPKRISDFRKRGDVALSRDATAVLSMAGGIIALIFGLNTARTELFALFDAAFRGLGELEMLEGLTIATRAFVLLSLPVIAGALVGLTIAAALQLGAPPAFKKLSFDPARIASAEAWLKLFSVKAMGGRGLKSLAKVGFVTAAGAFATWSEYELYVREPALDANAIGARLVAATLRVLMHAGLALALLAAIEFLFARRDLLARMRMTPEELKREMREQDGDPQIKRRRRQRMRELANRRLEKSVKGADVVVVNPTEYAVALRYRSGSDRAPRVVAKGRRAVAERIRELARTNGIPILAQPPLARLLYKLVREGREIPAQTYKAVAEILAYVYRLKQRRT
jgi:flagellar biosynthesis protein FlhB